MGKNRHKNDMFLQRICYNESMNKPKNKLLIVDGSNLLFQMFYGMPARIVNKQGKAIQGTLGFVGALLKIMRMTEPTHVVVLFDGEHENKRTQLDHDYKANRVEIYKEDENPFSQLDDIYAALDFLGIKHTETSICETDDWIASYALTYGDKIEIVVSSFDSDFFQLITDKVSVLRYRGKNTCILTPTDIKNKFGITPKQYADFKSLTGDVSDNIKGADKVGLKTASRLINQFGSLNEILKNAKEIKSTAIRDSIISNTEKLKLNYQIIKLDNNQELPFLLEDLSYNIPNITTNEVLIELGLK